MMDDNLGDSSISEEKPVISKKSRAHAKPSAKNGIYGNDPELSQLDDRALDAFMDAWDNHILPNPPELNDGYHYFWASTTNKWDPVEARLRGGYEFVRPEHIPNFEGYHLETQTRMNSGSHGSDNVITCNEMILLRCPQVLFERRMARYHHEMPYEQQRGLVDTMRGIPDRVGVKTNAPLEEGMLELEAEAKRMKSRPKFFVNEINKKKFELDAEDEA